MKLKEHCKNSIFGKIYITKINIKAKQLFLSRSANWSTSTSSRKRLRSLSRKRRWSRRSSTKPTASSGSGAEMLISSKLERESAGEREGLGNPPARAPHREIRSDGTGLRESSRTSAASPSRPGLSTSGALTGGGPGRGGNSCHIAGAAAVVSANVGRNGTRVNYNLSGFA